MANKILPDNDVIFDDDGNPVVNGTVTFYVSGTTTLASIYAEAAATTPLANPVTTDATGRIRAVFAATAIKAVIQKSDGSIVRTVDPCGIVSPTGSTASAIPIDPIVGLPKTGTPAANVQEALEAAAARITPWSDYVEFTFLPSINASTARTNLGLGDMAILDEADRTFTQTVWDTGTATQGGFISPAIWRATFNARAQNQSAWNTGTSTTEAPITPAKWKATFDNRALDQSAWNTGTSTTEAPITPAKWKATFDNRALDQSAWNTGTSTTEAPITPAKWKATFDNRALDQATWNAGTGTVPAPITPVELHTKVGDYITDRLRYAISSPLVVAAGSATAWSHGLGQPLSMVTLWLQNTASDGAFTITGQRINLASTISDYSGTSTTDGVSVVDEGGGTIAVYFGAAINVLTPAEPPTVQTLDLTKWRLVIAGWVFV